MKAGMQRIWPGVVFLCFQFVLPACSEMAVDQKLTQKIDSEIIRARYMERNGKLISTDDKLPGWEGFPVALYEYCVAEKDKKKKCASVAMLNPNAQKLATWIVAACREVKGKVIPECADQLIKQIRDQSGGQFPVAGIVLEDLNRNGVFEAYCFKDGVTVMPRAFKVGEAAPTPDQIDKCLALNDEDILSVGKYARLQGTTREEYRSSGGKEDVGDSRNRKRGWLKVVRESYQAAWKSETNELLAAWAKENVR